MVKIPELMKGRSVKVRRQSKEGYIEVTIPRILAENEVIKEGDKLTPFFNSILVYVPDGIELDFEKLKEATK